MCVRQYILENWKNTTRDNTGTNLPKPFSTPSIEPLFANFFYWDTYFINLGLLADGLAEQAKNNLDNIASFIRRIGYMPTASHLFNNTQPPLFTCAVFDYWQYSKDDEVLKEYFDAILTEYAFFKRERTTEIGLAQYGHFDYADNVVKGIYEYASKRLDIVKDGEAEQRRFAYNISAIGESGWDFTPRFASDSELFVPLDYVQVELNSLLYDMEKKIAQIYSLIGDNVNSEKFTEYANQRKRLMEKYMRSDANGIYYDYNFAEKRFSKLASAASFYPYVFGVTDDKTGLINLLKLLELDFGISACEDREQSNNLQWDYPIMWAPNVYFAHEALRKNGLTDDAERIAKKYMHVLEENFHKTDRLWEKYNAKTGEIASAKESGANPMLGWTGGVYAHFYNRYGSSI
ncbi:MAG: hypothetical protein IJZ32_05730 [Clostridia bacterium]|nr:hypothetical protein [Clostridia bacterium]